MVDASGRRRSQERLGHDGAVIRSFLERLRRLGEGPVRASGLPTSSNRASSLHLVWDAPPVPLAEVGATIEVIEPPSVDRLYFWALQVDFVTDGGGSLGGAHMGLQHHPQYPGAGAVNWGGYRAGGGELDGSVSSLPSTLGNANTRDYRWEPRRRYRYRIHRSSDRGWRASVTDLVTGDTTTIRDLWVDGDALARPMVWTEAFADCGEPPAAVRWTDLSAVTVNGDTYEISAARVNYQSWADGGCTNTNAAVELAPGGGGGTTGFVQRTGVERVTPSGATLRISGPAG